jgi:hypothetical protein
MRSDLGRAEGVTGVAGTDKYRAALGRLLEGSLAPGETIVAILPFTSTLKRPKAPGAPRGKKGKVRVGIYQSWRRYRPLVLTNRRLFVFETGRTPNPRTVLAAYPLDEVDMVAVTPVGRGVTRFALEFPDAGRVPFEAGRREREDLGVLAEWLGGSGDNAR